MNELNLEHARERLEVTAERGVPFNLNFWGRHSGEHNPEEHGYCGTERCGFGDIVLTKYAQRQGLTPVWKYDEYARKWNMIPHFTPYDHGVLGVLVVEYEDFVAAEKYFGIDNSTAHRLFDPAYYTHDEHKDPRAVADRIGFLLDNGEAVLCDKFKTQDEIEKQDREDAREARRQHLNMCECEYCGYDKAHED